MSSRLTQEIRDLARLAAPLAAAQAGTQLMGVVDVAVLGRLGAAELGAASLGISLFFAISIVGMGVVMGIDPLASQAIGAGDELRARAILWQGLWLAGAAGAVLTIPLAASPLLLHAAGIEPKIAANASLYVWIRALSLVPMLMFIVIRGYLQARGITRPLLIAMIAGNIFNLGAVILFVFGGSSLPPWCGPLRHFPAWGVGGASFATVLGTFLQLGIAAEAIRRSAPTNAFPGIRRFRSSEFLRALRVGTPVGLQMGAEVGIFALAGVLAGKFGATQLAAHQVVITLASFTFVVALGIGSAGSVRVGRAIGARDHAGTALAGRVAFAGGALFMSLTAAAFWIAPRPIAALLTDQREVIAAAVPLLAIAAVFQIFDGIQGVGAGVLRGAGDTRFTFFANLIGHWLVGFPIAMTLAFPLGGGVVGLWWGLCAGLAVVAMILFLRFYRLSSRPIAPL